MNKAEIKAALLKAGNVRPAELTKEAREVFNEMCRDMAKWEMDMEQSAAPAAAPVRATSAVPGVQPLRSPSEVSSAMQDARYSRDPAYRDDVARRIEAGEAAGYRLF